MLTSMILLACGGVVPAPSSQDSGPVSGCALSESLLDLSGEPTGFVRCEDGGVNRVASWQGSLAPYEGSYGTPWVVDDEPECASHEDCGQGMRCAQKDLGSCIYHGPVCVPVCASDADCEQDQVCVPPEAHSGWPEWPTCVAASCRTGDDCASGECGLAWEFADYSVWLACRTPEDVCRSNAQCEGESMTCGFEWCGSDVPCN